MQVLFTQYMHAIFVLVLYKKKVDFVCIDFESVLGENWNWCKLWREGAYLDAFKIWCMRRFMVFVHPDTDRQQVLVF